MNIKDLRNWLNLVNYRKENVKEEMIHLFDEVEFALVDAQDAGIGTSVSLSIPKRNTRPIYIWHCVTHIEEDGGVACRQEIVAGLRDAIERGVAIAREAHPAGVT